MTRVLCASIALLALVGCATEPGEQIVRSQQVICAKEEPTGSRLVRERCWTREQAQMAEEEARSMSEGARRQGPGPEQRAIRRQ
jgi:uncharacterized protein YcfL